MPLYITEHKLTSKNNQGQTLLMMPQYTLTRTPPHLTTLHELNQLVNTINQSWVKKGKTGTMSLCLQSQFGDDRAFVPIPIEKRNEPIDVVKYHQLRQQVGSDNIIYSEQQDPFTHPYLKLFDRVFIVVKLGN